MLMFIANRLTFCLKRRYAAGYVVWAQKIFSGPGLIVVVLGYWGSAKFNPRFNPRFKPKNNKLYLKSENIKHYNTSTNKLLNPT
jgi:hypothetical protein